MKKFAEKIIELRHEKGLTRKLVADAIGVTPTAIEFWENKKYEPRSVYIKALADFFHISCDYLLDDDAEFPY